MRWRSLGRIAIGLAVSAFVGWNCLRWSERIPFDGAPDEADHYAIQKFVAEHGRLPRYGEGEFSAHMMGTNHSRLPPDTSPERLQFQLHRHGRYELRLPMIFSPQMPYWLAGMSMRLLGGPSVTKARSFSALWIALAALCTYGAGLLLWRNPFPASVAALCFGLWPQVSFIGAYANDDAFAVFAVALLLLAFAWVRLDCLAWKRVLFMGFAVGVVASAKYYVYAIFPLLLVWWGDLWRRQGRVVVPRLAAGFGCAAVVAAPWFIRNAVLYDGDFLGREAAARYEAQYVATLPAPVLARTVAPGAGRLGTDLLSDQRLDAAELAKRDFLRTSLESFWGRFGWMNSRLDPSAYIWALYVLAGALSLSLLALPFLPGIGPRFTAVPHLFALPYLGLLFVISLYNSLYVCYQPQGRYFLSVVPALCLQCLDVPARRGKRIVLLVGSCLLAFFVMQNVVAWRHHLG